MQELQQTAKKYFGGRINIDQYAKFYLPRLIKNEQTVYSIMQLTNLPESVIIDRVQENVLSYEETLKFCEVYRYMPTPYQCIEIYLLGGFENWFKINKKA
jgi:hypothetical protein